MSGFIDYDTLELNLSRRLTRLLARSHSLPIGMVLLLHQLGCPVNRRLPIAPSIFRSTTLPSYVNPTSTSLVSLCASSSRGQPSLNSVLLNGASFADTIASNSSSELLGVGGFETRQLCVAVSRLLTGLQSSVRICPARLDTSGVLAGGDKLHPVMKFISTSNPLITDASGHHIRAFDSEMHNRRPSSLLSSFTSTATWLSSAAAILLAEPVPLPSLQLHSVPPHGIIQTPAGPTIPPSQALLASNSAAALSQVQGQVHHHHHHHHHHPNHILQHSSGTTGSTGLPAPPPLPPGVLATLPPGGLLQGEGGNSQ
ncbi:unnamed protein product [Protopolystoma xenopodis]|uniref:Uncharacterized protein n=1 Tax=Protopolystoma xenopodis TaxID=117903 RepID=A0A448WTM2_9PLAT|nr:unnamed protein product [Protopolystoma xenopodis]